MQNIYNDNAEVHDILDTDGIFTDKIKDLDGMKWKLIGWVSKERKTLFARLPLSLTVEDDTIKVNNNVVGNIESIDDNHVIKHLVTDVDERERSIQLAIAQNKADAELQFKVNALNAAKAKLNLQVIRSMNSWTQQLISDNDNVEEMRLTCEDLETDISEMMTGDISATQTWQLKSLLEKKENVERDLVKVGGSDPIRLLNTQQTLVAVYDTYLPHDIDNRKAEDELFGRIIHDADTAGLKDPNVEIMRMNLGNMYQRN
jgi:hypothetical protein